MKVDEGVLPTPGAFELRQSPVAAYRDDLGQAPWEPPSPLAAAGISIAVLLQAAMHEPSPADRELMIGQAAHVAATVVPLEDLVNCYRYDAHGTASAGATLRSFAELLEDGHFQNLARDIIDSLTLLYADDSVERGRTIMSHLRRAITNGEDDLVLARGKSLVAMGRRLRNAELLSFGWVGAACHAQLHGNLPRLERAAARAMKYARRTNDGYVLAMAENLAGVAAGLRGNLQASIEAFWRALQLTHHRKLRWMTLSSLAHSLYQAKDFRASRAARAMVVMNGGDINSRCSSLGGYAVSCAALGDRAGARWAAEQALAIHNSRNLRGMRTSRDIAQGLLGCAEACGQVGLDDLGRELYRRGMAIADAHGYHDLRFKPDPTVRAESRAAVPLVGGAQEARDYFVRMAPDGVAADFTLVVTA